MAKASAVPPPNLRARKVCSLLRKRRGREKRHAHDKMLRASSRSLYTLQKTKDIDFAVSFVFWWSVSDLKRISVHIINDFQILFLSKHIISDVKAIGYEF